MIKTQVQELEIFIAVVKHRSFSKAAQELMIAASAISRSIQKLEFKLQVTLFNRTTRKINLTWEGELLLGQATQIIEQLAKVENQLTKAQLQPAGVIKLDAASPFTLHAISPIICGFQQLFPKIKIILSSSEDNIDLIERNVDLAIRIGELSNSGLKARKLGNSYRKLYASPTYLQQHTAIRKVSDLASHSCLGFAKAEKLNSWPLLDNDGHWVKIQPQLLADSGETLKQLAVQHCGIVCISSFTVKQELESGKLVAILERETQQVAVPIYAVFYADNEVSLRIRCFLDYMLEHIDLGEQ